MSPDVRIMPKNEDEGRLRIIRVQVGNMDTNCYLLVDHGEVAVIDPGFEPETVLAAIDDLKANNPKDAPPIKVKYIINTHGHINHIGGNAEIKKATGAQLLIGAHDAEQLTDSTKNLSAFVAGPVVSPKPDRLLKEGDRVVVGMVVLKVIEAPGHTPGGICLIGDGFAFTGDTLFFASIGRTDFPGGSEKEIMASIKRIVSLLGDDTMIYPGHHEPGRLGDAKNVNPFLSWGH